MPLKLKLAAHEHLIVNGAVMVNGGCRATLILPVGVVSRDIQNRGRNVSANDSFAVPGRDVLWILGSGAYSFTGSL